jgi:hypothetical protein
MRELSYSAPLEQSGRLLIVAGVWQARKKEVPVDSSTKTVVFWIFILICLMLLWGIVQKGAEAGKRTEYSYSNLYTKAQNGQVLDATIQGDDLNGHLKATPKEQFHTTLPANYEDLEKAMLATQVNLTIKQAPSHLGGFLPVNFASLFLLAMAALVAIPPFWVIFRRAGFEPILSILVIVPLVNLIVLYIVAFSRWKASPAQVV